MARRIKYLWTVELLTPRGWEPCYEAEVNCSKAWADKDRKKLQDKYTACRYRVAKYVQAPETRRP